MSLDGFSKLANFLCLSGLFLTLGWYSALQFEPINSTGANVINKSCTSLKLGTLIGCFKSFDLEHPFRVLNFS